LVVEPQSPRALSLAIDRDIVAEKILDGIGLPSVDFMGTDVPADWPKTQADRNREAQRLWAQAGPLEKPRVKIEFTGVEANKRVLWAVADMWKAVLGVDATIVTLSNQALLSRRLDRKFEILLQVWRAGDHGGGLEEYLSDLQPDAPLGRWTGYVSPSFNSLFAQARDNIREPERNRLMEEAEAVALKDAAVIPIYRPELDRLVAPYVKGFHLDTSEISLTRDISITR
jgi:ABC-type transport system substrate-binding protein